MIQDLLPLDDSDLQLSDSLVNHLEIGNSLHEEQEARLWPKLARGNPGKSLGHCMELRENAGGNKNLFSAERKIRKQKLKMEKQRKNQYEREQQRSRCNVFDFINGTLSGQHKLSRLYFIYIIFVALFLCMIITFLYFMFINFTCCRRRIELFQTKFSNCRKSYQDEKHVG